MKKFFISLALFLMLTSVVYCVGLIAFGRFVPFLIPWNLPYIRGHAIGHTFTRFKEADKIDQDIDVLVIGPSRAYRGYDPRIFRQCQWRLFNLGSSAQTPVQTAYVLDRYVAKIRPKLVILEVAPELFASDGNESMVDFISNAELDIELVRLALLQKNIGVYNTLLYRVFADMLGFNDGFVEENPSKSGDLYVAGGYVESNNRYDGKGRFESIDYSFASRQVRAFERIIQRLQEKEIPYLILRSPVPRARYEAVTNDSFVDGFFSKYGYYQNANESLKLPDSCFSDNSHLNQSGTNCYNEYVINLIKQRGYLNR
ncbi:MAG TPA: hypothetical protein VN040_05815 [Pseudosphingobacterium sp.]|nr:hypothetical protein [Pseudosphingobacterium sp.]